MASSAREKADRMRAALAGGVRPVSAPSLFATPRALAVLGS